MTKNPTVEASMLIRKPVTEVFRAFIDPEITKNFWFTKSTGKMEAGKDLTWYWEMYDVSAAVSVLEIIPESKISFKWGDPSTRVDITFVSKDDRTFVLIRNYGFNLHGEQLQRSLMDNTGGFTTVLDGLKAYLEHGIKLNLIGDKFPPDFVSHRKNDKDD